MEQELLRFEIDCGPDVSYLYYQSESFEKKINPGHQNSFSFLRSVTIRNDGDVDLEDVVLSISFSGLEEPLMAIEDTKIQAVPAHSSLLIDCFGIRMDAPALYKIRESVPGQLTFRLLSKGEVVLTEVRDLAVLPLTKCFRPGYVDEILASYVTPNDPLVIEITKRASQILAERGELSGLSAYQRRDANYVLQQLDALYLAAQGLGIDYLVNSFSGECLWRLRTPRQVIEDKVGCCIDLSFLYASLCEAAGLNALLVNIDNHMLVGVWLEDGIFGEAKEERGQWLRTEGEKGFNRLVFVNAVCLANGRASNFSDAVDSGLRCMREYKVFHYALDIHGCRLGRVLPLPSPDKETGEVDFQALATDDLDYLLPHVDPSERRFIEGKERRPENRFDHWEKKLLDLDLGNRLINLPFNKSTVEFLVPDGERLLSFLAEQGRERLLMAASPKTIGPGEGRLTREHVELAEDGYRRGTLYFDDSHEKGDSLLKSLARKANTTIAETGCNPLFLTLGLIRWFPSEEAAAHSTGAVYSPIFLLPVRMPRQKSGPFYYFDYSIDDIQLNTTAFEYFRQAFGLDFGALSSARKLVDFDGKVDFRAVVSTIRKIILNMKNWAVVENRSVLGLFSFAHFVMWSDIHSRRKQLMEHPIIGSFVNGGSLLSRQGEEIGEAELDERIRPTEMAIPLPADSSQIKAIHEAEEGESFILDGPPGTGKSQTIANLIVDLIYHGKKVLFVAEKEVALNVVKDRLKELGLGDFCLEVANPNTPKSQILQQIGRLLELGPKAADGRKFQEVADEILAERNSLNETLRTIHERKDFFLSIYEAILLNLYHKDGAEGKRIEIGEEYVRSLSEETHKEALRRLMEVVTYDHEVGGYRRSPFRPYLRKEYSLGAREALKERLPGLERLLREAALAMENVCRAHPFVANLRANAELIVGLFKEFRSGAEYCAEFVGNKVILANRAAITRKLDEKKAYLTAMEAILSKWKEETLSLSGGDLKGDYLIAQNLPLFQRLGAMRKLRKRLAPYARWKESLTDRGISELSDQLVAYRRAKEYYESTSEGGGEALFFLAKSFPDMKKAADAERVLTKLARTFALSDLMASLVPAKEHDEEEIARFFRQFGEKPELAFDQTVERLGAALSALSEYGASLLKENAFDYERYPDEEGFYLEAAERTHLCYATIGSLSSWCRLLRNIEEAREAVPSELLDLYEEGKIGPEALVHVYEASLGYEIYVLASEGTEVGSLNSRDTERAIAEYGRLTKEFARLTVLETFARVSASFPDVSQPTAPSTKIASLRKICASEGRKFTLRRIFDDYGELIHTYCPCFLMSPVAVAQYLNPEKHKFDVVVFDEASQIPTSEAIGAISRGKSAIIAGDQQQMPPSNYFQTPVTMALDEEDAPYTLDEDLESLLDDALVIGFPRHRLIWHYRSRHESLIAFSNRRFYKNDLLTFPSPGEERSSVSFRKVNGRFLHGRRTNREEAESVVREIVRRLKDPVLRNRSIGVVTFNEAQQNLIEDLLEREFARNSLLSSTPGGETIFVKNLENVQGDERDCILFSVTYGPDKETGAISINFGPLSRAKGERRLNVAVSRAREEMIVFSSLQPEDIRAERAKNSGASYLRDFLRFAKEGVPSLPHVLGESLRAERPSVASFLAEDLRKLGFGADVNVGASTLKVDVAIRDPRKSDGYILGVLLDGESYLYAPTCRDRNLVQPGTLEGLGWNLMRLWSVEYFDHPKDAVALIVSRVNALLEETPARSEEEKKETSILDELLDKRGERNRNAVHYVRLPAENAPYQDTDAERERLSSYFRRIIVAEYPISVETLKERFRERYGLRSMGAAQRGLFQRALEKTECHVEFCGSDLRFLYPSREESFYYRFYRLPDPGEAREVTSVSYHELGNAMRDILEDQGKMTASDLYKQVSILFGNKLLTRKAGEHLERALRGNATRLRIEIAKDMTVSLRD